MDRGATGAVLAEMALEVNRPVHLLQADFQDGSVYLTDAAVNITTDSKLFVSTKLLGFSGLSETADLLVHRITITLSGVDQSVIAALMQETYLDRRVRIWKAFLTEALAVIADPLLIFDGRMDKPSINTDPDDGTCVCSVEAASAWTDFERRPGRHTNDAEQQTHYPGDKGMEYITQIPQTIFWGRPRDIKYPGQKFTTGPSRS